MRVYLLAALTGFAFSLVLCLVFIPVLRKLKAGQNILSYVKEHKSKSGTPTMGGLAFVFAALIATAIFMREAERSVVLALAIGLAYMAVGLIDDFLKKRRKENLGLRAWQKFSFQTVIAVLAGVFCLRAGLTSLHIPFINICVEIGFWIFPLAVFTFLATVNAVNLTDGLDGLAAGVSVPFFAVLGSIIALTATATVTATAGVDITRVTAGAATATGATTQMPILCFALTGALCAYLIFNTPPASVFMGDTGSLALGGFAASVGVFTGNALYILVLGLPFVFSVVSVILQVIYYKATGGKRIFLMAPAHHHFQEKGYSESKISYAYSLVSVLLGAVCLLCLG